jgi:dihydroneopterin aldolase
LPEGILRLVGLELRVVVGCMPIEKLHPRLVEMDLEWRGTCIQGSPPVLDYGAAALLIRGLEGRDFDYIEEIAFEALGLLKASFPGGLWTVRITKACPPTVLRSARAVFEVSG